MYRVSGGLYANPNPKLFYCPSSSNPNSRYSETTIYATHIGYAPNQANGNATTKLDLLKLSQIRQPSSKLYFAEKLYSDAWYVNTTWWPALRHGTNFPISEASKINDSTALGFLPSNMGTSNTIFADGHVASMRYADFRKDGNKCFNLTE